MHIRENELTLAHETYKSANISLVFCCFFGCFPLLRTKWDAGKSNHHTREKC